MIKILDPQGGDNFVGRKEEIKEVKRKIKENGVVVLTGERGIGKTNLILVVKEDMGMEKECHFVNGSLFSEEISKIFKPPMIRRIRGFSASFIAGGGINWDSGKPFVLEYMEKSKGKTIFVENAQELKKVEFETIFEATRRNNRLRFILEIATPYKYDVQLRGGSYEVVKLKELNNEDVEKIVIRECPNFSDAIVKGIIFLSRGYPYVARALAYICDRKNAEKEMFEFLKSLRDDDMSYNLNKIHKEVLETLNQDSQEVIKRLAIAPATLTSNLIEAFCGEGVDTSLNDIIERGILVKSEEKFYRIYHPLFREYLRDIQPIALQNKGALYCKAMENVKAEFDSIFMLFEANESDIFKLIELAENYGVVNYFGSQSYTWGKLDEAICAWEHIREKTKNSDKNWEAIATGNIGLVYRLFSK
jgi:energy-coupling factor transporter ATP-binding protein EcfA2